MEESYKTFLTDGEAFYKRALISVKKPEIFTNEILYNITAMSIEKYFMAYLVFNKQMPDNHTFTDLIHAVGKLETLDTEFVSQIQFLDQFQEICSFDLYSRKKPDEKDIRKMIEIGAKVRNFVFSRINS